MAILRHAEASPNERAAYLKQALAVRRAQGADVAEGAPEPDAETESTDGNVELSPDRYAELGALEQFVLTVSERGFGKRSSSYDYRISGRGGKGLVAMIVNERNGRLVASFAVDDNDQIMLVTDGGKLIRCPVDDVRIAARNTQGVRIFKTEEDEKVVSAERIPEDATGGEEVADDGAAPSGDGQRAIGSARDAPDPSHRRRCRCAAPCVRARSLLQPHGLAPASRAFPRAPHDDRGRSARARRNAGRGCRDHRALRRGGGSAARRTRCAARGVGWAQPGVPRGAGGGLACAGPRGRRSSSSTAAGSGRR